MRPEILFSLFAPVTTLPSVGDKTAKLLEKLCGRRVLDVCYHFPSQTETRMYLPSLKHAKNGKLSTMVLTVGSHAPGKSLRHPYCVYCRDQHDVISLVFFRPPPREYLHKMLPEGSTRLVSGFVDKNFGVWQMVHPDHIGDPKELEAWSGERPIYPLTTGLHKKSLTKIIHAALSKIPDLPEWLPEETLKKHSWSSWKDSIAFCHTPQSMADTEPTTPARQRLAFDELLAYQLTLKLVKGHQAHQPGAILKGDKTLQKKLLESLPFSLTKGQTEAIGEIQNDLASSKKMLRLLQGDVGSGKTLVAFFAMLSAMEAGYQATFLAPTEILAKQHYANFQKWGDLLSIKVGLFIGTQGKKEKESNKNSLKEGDIQIAIGTHALLEDDVVFKKLGLVVIDEQHRFGVDQRSALIEKSAEANVLVMTATPIPRTLALTLYGDIDISTLREKPAFQKPIETRLLPLGKLPSLYEGLKRLLEKGDQAYWICPLIEESESLDLGHAEARFRELSQRFGDKVGLLHGRLKPQEKEAVMQKFQEGTYRILVSTTVVEVGVDVPNATAIIIEHAERFGLFQLHQLRGRVGRGEKESSCVLLYKSDMSETGKKRLTSLRESNDGFEIAEADLKIRGSGDLLGTRQSGMPNLRFFTFSDHAWMIQQVNDYASQIINENKHLAGDLSLPLKCLLHLFDHEKALQYTKSG